MPQTGTDNSVMKRCKKILKALSLHLVLEFLDTKTAPSPDRSFFSYKTSAPLFLKSKLERQRKTDPLLHLWLQQSRWYWSRYREENWLNCAQEVETTEKNMITEKVDAVRDRVKRARDNLRVKVHMHMYTHCCRELLLRLLSRLLSICWDRW